jgi:tRNA(fMet)-specific endonuclease VapC
LLSGPSFEGLDLTRDRSPMREIDSWGDEAAEVHADIRHRMLSVGRTFGEMDMMIAAHAIAPGAVLVTNNTKHLERLAPALTIENWAVDDR